MTVALFCLLFCLFVYFLLGFIIAYFVVHPRRRNYDMVLKQELEAGNLTDKGLLDLPYVKYHIKNAKGHRLTARYYRCQEPRGKYILFNHGYNYPWMSALKYLPVLLERGISVLIPDHAGEGESEGRGITFGYYEQYDSLCWLDFLETLAHREGIKKPRLGVMGESMGAAISLLMASKDDRIRVCVADCPYSSWKEVLAYRCENSYGKYAVAVLPAVRLGIFLLTGARVGRVDVKKAVRSLKREVFVIHGIMDTTVPFSMSQKIAKASDKVTLFLQADATHANSIARHYSMYRENVANYLERNGF